MRDFAFESKPKFVVEPWNVVLLNDDKHSFHEVILQLMKATGYSLDKALAIALQAHTNGEAVCFTGARKHCQDIASVLGEIDLGVRLEP